MTRKRRQPRVYIEFRNIRTLPSGYQVAVTRNKQEFSKHFAGHSDAAVKAAIRWRDQILRLLPNKRNNPIPPRVLAALHLQSPVVGVFRSAYRNFYQVSYRGGDGRQRARAFSWKDRAGEIEAYRKAVKFRRQMEREA
ncbi:MAG: hypothetical protein H0U99_08455 [Chthoniobacterales bacterium]|nr:hypothetical protein [Chthoniobacterales bacterium]